ncbi:P12 family lipoprotein (plasmid) [Borrelia miyamotoi]|uniref:P12 family lipoprotein n=1 Tax=Borrelia miyamotoi TaxID=47466 RepID=A0AAQ3CPC4_9SPIR|nr:P12 family lipoprotein [Borrelia miyamotoi]WAZ71429.1 P12 family lipoprotein [Borrelia miyamotoi]WCB91124.1 P12 family lipoprotein [Borrelia miyamotoi]WCL22240.1 P12 family lipoprotein [Borrelia miyamotoi]WDE71739.1 P12 family lipoprotein [Borrelia miyamotoi]WDE73449.1 P12 family lipoprotein [Borrelia miyamotoi]
MNKSVLALCMLILLSLLSCDINALNEMLIKAREKYLKESKKVEDVNSKDGNQESEEAQEGEVVEQVDGAAQHMGKGVKEVLQVVSVVPVNVDNAEIPVILNSPYYPYREEIKIREEDLVLSTKEEKEAQEEIEKVKSVLGGSEFAQLVEEERKFKSEYKQLESSFYGTLSELQNKIGSYSGKTERQKLIQLSNQFKEKRADIDELNIQLESGLSERTSARYFFEQAKETLKEAITERLKNKRRNYWSRKVDSDLLVKKSQSEAENALSQLESSSFKIGEAMERKK